ncbi:MAG: hypothetical protein WA021_03400 [Minisyncoccia bacterium]
MIRAVIGLAVISAIALWWFVPLSGEKSLAASIVEVCAEEESRSTCYEKKVPELFPKLPLSEVFGVIRDIRALDQSYQFCHVVAHKLGESAVAQDPSKWIDLIPLNPPDGLCSNGFIHGIIVGRFRNDVLDDATLTAAIPDFARACERRADWRPSGLDQAICYHGMGHLFMFITNANIKKSLETCAHTTGNSEDGFMRVCREGVFMQIYQPLEPDDFALIELLPEKPSRENFRRLCAAYAEDEDEGACLREAWPFFRAEIMKGDVAAFCAHQPNSSETDKCYESATTIVGRQLLGMPDQAVAACSAITSRYQELCFTTVAQALLEEDRTQGEKAVAFCVRAPTHIKTQCIATLAERARWIFPENSSDRTRLCEAMPAEYRSSCAEY